MNAIAAALEGLIDYAGLYPPAALDMPSAVHNYLAYREQKHAFALGRFIVDAARLDELRVNAGSSISKMRLSVIVPAVVEPHILSALSDPEFPIESTETKGDQPLTIARICEKLPFNLERYCEIPMQTACSGTVDAIASVGARAKLRMGGVVAEAFPPTEHVIHKLRILADRRVAFKATAGLHHPIRSPHPLTYSAHSPTATMHGFINLLCAAAMVHFGVSNQDVLDQDVAAVLEDQPPHAFRASPGSLGWRGFEWTTDQVREVRQFFTSFGSCSFTEPIHDLEVLGWL